jgi:hypothetical protein
MIAEAENLKALRFDRRRASGVGLLSIVGKMLPAIEFDHELRRVTDEIGDEVLDGDLTPEAGAVQTMIAQLQPEDSFRVG